MDWLVANHDSIHCAQGSLSFCNTAKEEILVHGKNNKPKACLVKASIFLRGMRSGQQIFIVKLNKMEEPKSDSIPECLWEFFDVFSEDLTDLPPPWDIDHEIETFSGSEPVSKRPYKMSLPKAINLKDQLRQLLE